MKWIKCVDKLPEDQEECFVALEIMPDDPDCGYGYHLATYSSGIFYTWEIGMIIYPTHWMKLPRAPK